MVKRRYKNVNHNGDSVGYHRVVAERVLGHTLPPRAVVHHVNDDSKDNRPDNLVICPNQSYHRIIHRRQRALEQSGNANYRLCQTCKKWDDPSSGMSLFRDVAYHKKCRADKTKENRRLGLWK